MADENQGSEQEAVENLYKFVAAEMEAGSDKATIASKLEEMGVEPAEARQMAQGVYDDIAASLQQEQFTSAAIGPGLIGGILASIAGGAVWAGIVIGTDYELGIIAWGIGGLCGFAVVMAAKGRKGLPLQVIAVLTSVLGIVIGKYFSFYYFVKEAMAEESGQEGVAELSVLSMDMIRLFIDNLPAMVSGYDALWILLAVVTAWRIPKPSGIQLKSAPPQSPIQG